MDQPVLSTTKNLYSEVTAKIVAAMQENAGRFKMPWHTADSPASMPFNAATDAAYRGINILSLWIDALGKGYPSGRWASYRQWKTLGAQVRKGERGAMIVFYKRIEPSNDNGSDEGTRQHFFARASFVFNAAQVEGWMPPAVAGQSEFAADSKTEAFVSATKARIRHGLAMARYRIDLDDIEMPNASSFEGTATSSPRESYYAVLLHELTHWSGASHRLDRQFGKRFGDQAYAFEELVAELGAAFLCAALGIANDPRADHAAYLSSWLEILGRDQKAIFTAASRAQEAVEYLGQLAAATCG